MRLVVTDDSPECVTQSRRVFRNYLGRFSPISLIQTLSRPIPTPIRAVESTSRGDLSGVFLIAPRFAIFFLEVGVMAEGTIKRLTDKGFGFIDAGTGQDMFFHMSNLEGVTFEELREGQRVSFTEGQGPFGP